MVSVIFYIATYVSFCPFAIAIIPVTALLEKRQSSDTVCAYYSESSSSSELVQSLDIIVGKRLMPISLLSRLWKSVSNRNCFDTDRDLLC